MKLFATILLSLFVLPAFAVDFAWQAPAEYENGTALDLADMANYSLICEGQTFTYPSSVSTSTEDFAPGTYSCVLTITSTAGETSGPSNVVSFTVAPPPLVPNPPILTVTN